MSKECDTSRMTSAEVEAMRAISRAKHAGTYVEPTSGMPLLTEAEYLASLADIMKLPRRRKPKKKAPMKPVKAVKRTKSAPKVKPKAKKRG